MPRYCSTCGTELFEGMRICPKCGRKLNWYKN
ncbi:MAG: zinc-ribbon domain-containing protein [Clostridium sp.]|nr:zinc-ribbon domain-containing protein [Clostridium sp.]